jgi:hypothetical protein
MYLSRLPIGADFFTSQTYSICSVSDYQNINNIKVITHDCPPINLLNQHGLYCFPGGTGQAHVSDVA